MKYDVPKSKCLMVTWQPDTPKIMCPAWDAYFFKRLRCFLVPWHSPASLQKPLEQADFTQLQKTKPALCQCIISL